MRGRFAWLFFAFVVLVGTGAGPLPPDEALRTIRVAKGFRVELAASEPLVHDPIAFDWGADGRLWVVEMGDYPLGLDGKGSPGGVVKVLVDRDGDARYHASTVFLDKLGFPTGVMPWRDGVLISRAPDILFARDTDGDDKADRVDVLFTGFVPGNPQHRVNGFELGLDGRVYGANGDSGGTIRVPGSAEGVSIRGRDFRFDPDSSRFEAESGQAQFGRHRDDWGHWFGNNNSIWAWQVVLPESALRRNPSLTLATPRKFLDPVPNLVPDSVTAPRFNSPGSANKVTSANSPTPYRDDLFGPGFESALFVSEPVHNLVRRMVLEQDGTTLKGHAALDDGREFLASTDPWFRPTMLKTGPDGALYVADMYRAVIEHPEWIPDAVEKTLDLREGAEQGRIYRVVSQGAPRRPIPRLDKLDTPGLVRALDHPNGWHRDTAQRLLMHRRDPLAIGPLRDLARSGQSPKTRVQSLWTLRALGGLDRESTELALKDAHPQVRRAAIEAGGSKDGIEAMASLADDPHAEVRMALAVALGEVDDVRAARSLARLIVRDGNDPWMRAAILSSAKPQAPAILAALFEASGPGGPPGDWVEPLIGLASIGAGPSGLAALVGRIDSPTDGKFAPWQFSAASGLAEAAERSRSPELTLVVRKLDRLHAAAVSLAGDEGEDEGRRVEAIRVLGRREGDRAVLAALLKAQVPARVQDEALRMLARSDDRRVADVLTAGWAGFSPRLRSSALDTLLSRPAWTSGLLSALEDTCVPAAEIPPAVRRRLLEQPDSNFRARASTIFDRAGVSPRREVVEAYRPALKKSGDPAAGLGLFRKSCASCHKLEGVGTPVGPDLLTLSDASPEALLIAILDPNRAFEAKYSDYTVHTKDGRVLSGLIAGESANSLTLLRQDGREDVLLRSEIEGVTTSGRSLMPEGFEKEVDPQGLADLMAYIAATRAPSPSKAKADAR